MKKTIILSLFCMLFGLQVYAQYHLDALRYSRQFYSTTAKSEAMGNSLSAVGADMSALTINPAGMAVFKGATCSGTMNFTYVGTKTGFADNRELASDRLRLNFTSVGYVGVFEGSGAIVSYNFGLAYNNIGDFTMQTIGNEPNGSSSILDFFVYNANNDRFGNFREVPAEDVGLLNKDSGTGEYWSYVTDDGRYGLTQRHDYLSRGSMGEIDLSFGMNIEDKVFVGFSMGVPSVSQSKSRSYTELSYPEIYDTHGVIVSPDKLKYTQESDLDGVGINAKLGIICQPVPFLRVGAAVHTPSAYKITEEYTAKMTAKYPVPYQGQTVYTYESELNEYEFLLNTPFRVNAGLGIVLEPISVGNYYTVPLTFSFDYEYVDYSRIKLKNIDAEFDPYLAADNDRIKRQFGQTHNFKTGLELALWHFKIRGGASYYQSPYTKDDSYWNNGRVTYSGGLGYSTDHFFFDLGYSYALHESVFNLYEANDLYPENPMGGKSEPQAHLNHNTQFYKFTFGVRF